MTLVASARLDDSWQAALEMALHLHLAFGPQVIFTYGPLGFLAVGSQDMASVWYGSLAIISLTYTLAIRFVLSAALYNAARRTYGSVAGFLLALVAVVVVAPYFADLAVLLIFLVWILELDIEPRRELGLVACAAGFAAFESLQKVSIGATAALMVAVYVLAAQTGRARLTQIAVAALTYVVTLLALWLALGQPMGALPVYVHGSYEISAGYSAAMSTTQRGFPWALVAALLLGLAGLWAAWRSSSQMPTRRRVGVLLIWCTYWFSAFKEGFVRQDGSHAAIFFAAMVAGVLAFQLRGWRRLASLACLGVCVYAWVAVLGITFDKRLDPPRSISTLVSNIRQIADSDDRAKLLSETRARVIRAAALPSGSLKLLRGHTVGVYPNELAVAWAYRLDWRPLPVLQSYSAYTPWLDRLDADSLASGKAPERMIVQAGTADIDGRFLGFDEPYTTLAIFCRYRPLLRGTKLGIFARTTDRCSKPQRLKTVHAAWGETVPVPSPPTARSLVLARITGAQPGGFGSLAGALFKPATPTISINGMAAVRLVAATASDALPLTAPPDVDYPWPYTVTPMARTIAVSGNGANQPSGLLTYSFYTVTVRRR